MKNIPIFAFVAISLLPNTAMAQASGAEQRELQRASEEIAALIEAENRKSVL